MGNIEFALCCPNSVEIGYDESAPQFQHRGCAGPDPVRWHSAWECATSRGGGDAARTGVRGRAGGTVPFRAGGAEQRDVNASTNAIGTAMDGHKTASTLLFSALLIALTFALAGCASLGGAEEEAVATREGSAKSEERDTEPTDAPPVAERQRTRRMPTGDTVEIRKSWTQIRSAPSRNARAIALAFGNDTLSVVEKEGDWVQVRFGRNQKGWIPVEATRP